MTARPTPVVKALKDQWALNYVYTVGDSKTVYRRLVGGLAWAGPESRTPSCGLCVLAEERDKEFSTGQHHVRVIYEAQFAGVEDTLAEAARLQDVMKCLLWTTPMDSPESLRVQQWTRERVARRLPRLSIVSPPVLDFAVMHNMALKRTSTHKTLFFGDKSLAAVQYVSVRPDDFYRPVRVFPHVAACLYALAILEMRPHDSATSRQKPHQAAEGGY